MQKQRIRNIKAMVSWWWWWWWWWCWWWQILQNLQDLAKTAGFGTCRIGGGPKEGFAGSSFTDSPRSAFKPPCAPAGRAPPRVAAPRGYFFSWTNFLFSFQTWSIILKPWKSWNINWNCRDLNFHTSIHPLFLPFISWYYNAPGHEPPKISAQMLRI